VIALPATEPDVSDAEAIRRSLVEPSAFGAIFDRHFGVLYKFLGVRVGWHDAEDLAAETLTIAFDRRSTFDLKREDARAWLFGIALNLVRSHARGRRRFSAAVRRVPLEAAAEEVTSALTGLKVAAEPLRRALADLDEESQTLLLLFACVDLSYAEIADVLQMPIGTVRSRLHRTRAVLRARLAVEAEQ
jgi:RNA polymerase sigma factor (sigma-70 family)